ncbi:MAG: tetratricopeptide repeat protein [Chloroflexi bacterium]|nr:tetratricopeptide repeat protein [Chloroflexota bacterium]
MTREPTIGGPNDLPGGLEVRRDNSIRPNPKYTVPNPRGGVLRRQRLVDALHENLPDTLQLISAPAGFGKTSLLADFARDTDLPVAWYGVDERDRDPYTFLRNIAQAIKFQFPALDDLEVQAVGLFSDDKHWRSTAGRLVDWVREYVRNYFVLIVDDLHTISPNSSVRDAMDYLVQRLPDNCRLIISTREIPQLTSLPKLISQRKVSGLGATELKFKPEEIQALFHQNFDIEISIQEAHGLEEESQGWITSILLTTHSLWKGLFRETLVARGKTSLLYEYIASEVFSQQRPAIQTFLLSTSICNEFDTKIAETLTGASDSSLVLDEVESAALFLSRLGESEPWFQYHHLFRDFLREKLKREDPPGYLRLNVKAADYFLTVGEPAQAIQHLLQASEFERALRLLEEQIEPMSHSGLWETIAYWMDQVPFEQASKRPRLLVALAHAYQMSGKTDEAVRLLNTAIERCRSDGQSGLEAQALLLRSTSLRFKGAYQMAIRDAREALSLATDHGTPTDVADAHNQLGTAYARQGKFPRAEREFRTAMKWYQQEGNLYQLSDIHKKLGSIYSELGDTFKASTHLELARQGWEKLGNQAELAVTLNNMSYLYYQQGQYSVAEPLAKDSISIAMEINSPRDQAHALMTLSDIKREQGEHPAALELCHRSLDLAKTLMETPLVTYGSAVLGETYRLTGDTEKARSLLKEALAMASEPGLDLESGLALTSLGIIEYQGRNFEDSGDYLSRACEILTRAGQKCALAKSRIHLAQLSFLTKDYPQAIAGMEEVAELCKEMGHHGFLTGEARSCYLLVQYAATRCKSKEFWAQIADQIAAEPTAGNVALPAEETPRSTTALAAPKLEVYTLGAQRIILDGKAILSTVWGSAKAREMFLFMLYKRQPLHKEKIVEALWPEITWSKANSNFHSTLYRMRSALYPNCVDRDGELYQLNPSWTYWLDALVFSRLVTDAEALPIGHPDQENVYERALDLYHGPLLGDCRPSAIMGRI